MRLDAPEHGSCDRLEGHRAHQGHDNARRLYFNILTFYQQSNALLIGLLLITRPWYI